MNFYKYLIIILLILNSNDFNKAVENLATVNATTYSTAKMLDNERYQRLKEEYKKFDYKGGCEIGDISKYDFYRKQFKKLMIGEKTLYDKNGEEFLLKDYGRLEGSKLSFKDYTYYFFDIDKDSKPELCIEDNCSFIYIIKYDENKDSFKLWQEYEMTYLTLVGTEKLRNNNTNSFAYIILDENGEFKDWVRFRVEGKYDKENDIDEKYYMVTLPQNAEENKETKDKFKKYIFEYNDISYVKVNEKQFNELNEILEKVQNNSLAELEKAAVSYDYLMQ